ncbi:MAG TPA: IS200/IS605 family transposase [Armatimonadota bacterium]|jgi:REP element-mobilizing transposase RayT
MSGSFAALYYHLVFSTKDRLPFLAPDIAPRVHEYLGGMLRELGGVSLVVGGAPDHVHLLASIDKTIAVADALRAIKAGSSKWIHHTFPTLDHFAWQEGYGAFSVSVTGVDRVKAYIAGQPEHHRAVTFQEEFLEFLHRHHIAYDVRYIWL